MFIKDICKNIAFYTRNQISSMQHDWGRFRQRDKWKLGLVVNIAAATVASILIVGAAASFVLIYGATRVYAYPLFIAMNVGVVLTAVYLVRYFIYRDVKEEEEKNIKEFCED